MALNYPLSLPSTNIMSVTFRARNAVAYSRSPFTYDGQVHAYSGQAWEADVTLPPMNNTEAEAWVAFLISLRGQYGTFLMGDPLNTSLRGTASQVVVSGAAGESSLDVTMGLNTTVKAGDWLQLGSASDATLHKVLKDHTGNGGEQANSLEIWPALRKARTGVTAIISDTVGVWRLNVNETEWSISDVARYGISFGCVEAI